MTHFLPLSLASFLNFFKKGFSQASDEGCIPSFHYSSSVGISPTNLSLTLEKYFPSSKADLSARINHLSKLKLSAEP